jgi:hypothetical protein
MFDQSLIIATISMLSVFFLIGILEAADKIYERKYGKSIVKSDNNIIAIILVFIFISVVILTACGYIYLCIYAFTP